MSAWGAKIARVDQPAAGLLCLTVRSTAERGTLILSLLPGGSGLGFTKERPRGAKASESVTQLRSHLVGASIVRVEEGKRFFRVCTARGERRLALIASARRPLGAWWLIDETGRPLVRSGGAPPLKLNPSEKLIAQSPADLAAGEFSVLASHRNAQQRRAIRELRQQTKRLLRKRDAIRTDLERTQEADAVRERATLILAHAHEIPAKAESFEARAWDGSGRMVRIELDPRQPPAQEAQRLFRMAKRLKRGQGQAARRLAEVEADLRELEQTVQRLDSHDLSVADAGPLASLPGEPSDVSRPRVARGPRLPYREFVAQDQRRVLVGRNAKDNDQLTLRYARPHDLWLHARGVSGAHVVVPLGRDEPCPSEVLVDAATLAAHFSDSRGEGVIDVLYTARRFVHKRKGSAAGSVTLGKEKVLALRMQSERLERLLRSERKQRPN